VVPRIPSDQTREPEIRQESHKDDDAIIETQNTNVAACRFYASRGCTLQQANRGVYPELPLEIQLIWNKTIDPTLRGLL
jgi:hypothetical protein